MLKWDVVSRIGARSYSSSIFVPIYFTSQCLDDRVSSLGQADRTKRRVAAISDIAFFAVDWKGPMMMVRRKVREEAERGEEQRSGKGWRNWNVF